MKRKILLGIIIIELGILIGYVYSNFIIPQLINFPLMHDIASDYIGAQALINDNQELYPILSTAFEKIGISWAAYHRSTHPPTAYLFVVPLTILDYPNAQTVWMLIMFLCIVLTWHTLSLSWGNSIIAGLLSLAWPPTIWSLGQLTPIWLLGLAFAYHNRERPTISGIYIAVASLPKFLAGPSLLYHLWKRKWSALLGFSATWLAALAIVLLLRPDGISSYISSNSITSLEQIMRLDNSALLIFAWRAGGWLGIIIVVILILYALWMGFSKKGIFGWACLVWVGIALLPIAWLYSIFPLLPWLIITVRSSSMFPRLLAIVAIILPYLAPVITYNPWAISLSIALSGISFALAAKLNNNINSDSFIILD